jgi:glutamyl-tRNA reductase
VYVVTVGLNHKAAPVEIREKIAFPEQFLSAALSESKSYFRRSVILSTCNRTEIYCATSDPAEALEKSKQFLSKYHELDPSVFEDCLYMHSNESAVRHIFSVSSGIDSMILGESQILGQVKTALENSISCQSAGKVLARLFTQALTVGKRSRTETAIGRHAVSISSVAVELAKKIFGDLENQRILIIGAGEMAELAAKTLIDSGARHVVVANRTYSKAIELAEKIGGKAARLEDLTKMLIESDIVISSTGSPKPFIDKDLMVPVMKARRNTPIFLIDIAVPRDMVPQVGRMSNVFHYDIDELEEVITENQHEREKEVENVINIVDEETEKYINWMKTLDVVPLIVAIRKNAESIRQAELERFSSALNSLTEDQRESIHDLTSAIVNKILHEPTVQLKSMSEGKSGYLDTEVLKDLFGVNGKNGKREKS